MGGGTVGLFLAHRFKNSNIDFTIIESGDTRSAKSKNLNYINKNLTYTDKNNYQRIGIGGTSKVWGGQMIPIQKSDIENRKYIKIKPWNIKYKTLKKYFNYIKFFFKFNFLKNNSYIFKIKQKNYFFAKKIFDLRFSTFINNRDKNFFNFFHNEIIKNKHQKIYINAKVTDIINSKDNSSVKKIIAESENGKTLEIIAQQVIVCCGFLESTKLLLMYNKKYNNFISNKSPLGYHFSEQLSIIAGKIKTQNWRKFSLLFSPFYYKGCVYNSRLELKKKFQVKNKMQSAFCHFLYIYKKNKKKKIIYNPFKFFLSVYDFFF